MEFVILFLSTLVIAQCRNLNHAEGEKGPFPDESERAQICIDKHLGCFPDPEPNKSTFQKILDWPGEQIDDIFYRDSRETVGTEFRFWTRNKTSAEIITNGNFHVHITEDSHYDTKLMTYFIVHGYFGGDVEWAVQMKDALLRREACNVFIVDWGRGARYLYGTATENTWVVAAELGRFIERIMIIKGLKLEKVHIIGKSLGAHVSGYAGKWLKYRLGKLVGRITGLDPAGPDFHDVLPGKRLDRGDAAFVDVIHTDGAESTLHGLGLYKPIGHFDFYPNGGEDQSGCPTTGGAIASIALEASALLGQRRLTLVKDNDGKYTLSVIQAAESFICSHDRSVDLFIESINSQRCRFLADECASWGDYKAGKCRKGRKGKLRVPMGFKAKRYRKFIIPNTSRKFYLSTNPTSPFCME